MNDKKSAMRRFSASIFQFSFCILFLFSCGKPPEKTESAGIAYDPRTDPLVNPPSLFEPPPSDLSQIASDETLYLQLDGSPNTLMPFFLSSLYEQTVAGTLYDGPFTIDNEMNWMVNEDMIESFEESEDHITFTIRFRPGLKWQDGHPFTAHDVVYSWQQILDPQVPALSAKVGTDQIVECVAVDDRTVRMVMKEALATAKWNLSFPIIAKHIFEKHKAQHPDLQTGEYYNRQARSPVGNGPYRIVEWKENDRVVVERWEEYPGKKPYFKRIVFRIIPDNNVALLSFEKGDVDALRRLSPQQFARETNTESFAKVGYKGWAIEWAYSYIGWNMDGTNPFFNDKRVRYAMTHAMNIDLILDKVFFNLYTRCLGEFHPDSWMFNKNIQPLDYDPKKSAALLDEAGWRINPADGWRYKEIQGKRVLFEFELLIPQGSPTSPKIAAIFQEDLKRLGVRMKTRELEWSAFLEKVQKHEFQAEIAAWGTAADPDYGWNLWRTEEYKTGRNYGGYSNAEVDRLFEQGRKAFDFEERAKIYQQIHAHIYGDQPYTFIANVPTLAAFHKRIRGVQYSPRGIYGFHPSFLGWWVAKNQSQPVAFRP